MKRIIYKKLVSWKNDPERKPLILKGARQVGKTYILQEFGRNEYSDVAYFNFEEDETLNEFFYGRIDAAAIIEQLSIYLERKILPRETLIIFDEVQNSPRTLTSLKYFCEQNNEYHIVASGSLLGIKLSQNFSFPVGMVNLLNLYPLSFYEFLEALGKPMLVNMLLDKRDFSKLPEAFHKDLLQSLKKYFYIGGMPEAINRYIEYKDFDKVRQVQKEILVGYETDFAKHTSKHEALKISKVWNNIPLQLARENRKFKFSLIDKNARARDYKESIEWLLNTGLIYKINNVKIPQMPLAAYSQEDVFKIYLIDIGLLGAMLDVTPKTILGGNALFNMYKGSIAENFVVSELKVSMHESIFYWKYKNLAEVDFIMQTGEDIFPLEVKSGENVKSKSLKIYDEKYHPNILSRTSGLNFSQNKKYRDYPLYAISQFPINN